jgi:hypothetical protein
MSSTWEFARDLWAMSRKRFGKLGRYATSAQCRFWDNLPTIRHGDLNEAAGAAIAAVVAAEQFGGWYKYLAEAWPPRVVQHWKSLTSSAQRASSF